MLEKSYYKLVEMGRNLRRPSDPGPLLKQGTLQHVAQDYVHMAFEDLHNPSG